MRSISKGNEDLRLFTHSQSHRALSKCYTLTGTGDRIFMASLRFTASHTNWHSECVNVAVPNVDRRKALSLREWYMIYRHRVRLNKEAGERSGRFVLDETAPMSVNAASHDDGSPSLLMIQVFFNCCV